MIKKTVTFEDYEGETHTQDFWFNLSKAELMEIELSEKGGFSEAMQEIIKKEDGKKIIGAFKTILLMSIGERRGPTEFRKNDDIREAFEGSPAFSEIFMELATNAQAGADFVNGVMPRQLAEQVQSQKTDLVAKMQAKTEEMAHMPGTEEMAHMPGIEKAAELPDFSAMSPEEFATWQAMQG